MSSTLTSRSPDLARLVSDGYQIEIRNNYLLVKAVPYVKSDGTVGFGTLVSTLTLADGVTTARPETHVVYFIGEYPHKADGTRFSAIEHMNQVQQLGENLIIQHSFSSKPPEGYPDYHAKMTIYAEMLANQAQMLDPTVSARRGAEPMEDDTDAVFHYPDTASSRAEINMVSRKLALDRVAIVGLGGTGSYVLDLISKTPVRQIHLIDGDDFAVHNAFRAPGAPSAEQLAQHPKKVHHFHAIYSQMHKGIIVHDRYVDPAMLDLLATMDFVFVCIDGGPGRTSVIQRLRQQGIPFVDVGMGLNVTDQKIFGSLRVSCEVPGMAIPAMERLPLSEAQDDNLYAKNIQIADLNALNASLAVIRWKRYAGFYGDFEQEAQSIYVIDANQLLNEQS